MALNQEIGSLINLLIRHSSNDNLVFIIGRSRGRASPLWCEPWIALFVLPRRINVFQHGGD